MSVEGHVLGTPAYMSPEQARAMLITPTAGRTSTRWA